MAKAHQLLNEFKQFQPTPNQILAAVFFQQDSKHWGGNTKNKSNKNNCLGQLFILVKYFLRAITLIFKVSVTNNFESIHNTYSA